MHELSIAQALIEQIDAQARQHGAGAVGRVVVRIGVLSGVEPALLATAFPLAAAGGVAESAELVLEPLPARARCTSCGAEFDAPANRLVCPHCGEWRTELLAGDELILASLELIGIE